ncbi:MAG: universal stress protein [Chloroflexi bacterium]|nr:universal stress protein [Chloroflexota bacterium]
MFKHFLVPLDGSKLAEAILPIAQSLAARLSARVTLLHVVEAAAPATIHGDAHLLSASEAETYLARITRQFRDAGIGTDVHIDRVEGRNAAKAIFAHVPEFGADVVLLTSHGRGALREKVFGSIALQVLQSENVPVLMVRSEISGAAVEFRLNNILVPLDSSPLYEPALDVATGLAQIFNASLHLLVVVPTANSLTPERAATAMLLPSSTRAILDLAENGAAEYLQAKSEKLKVKSVNASARVERGDVVGKIVEAAERAPSDLIVMATHGRAGLDAFWSGSIAPKVLSRVRAPVLLLRVKGEEPLR